MELLSGLRFPVVSVLPTASANTGKVFEQGGHLWFSDGSAWQQIDNVAGSGLTHPQVLTRCLGC